MRGDFPDDTFTQTDVEAELARVGLKYYDKGRYLLAQCPTHEDKHPSVQIYKDDWFVNCHADCGRFHITKAFPELRNTSEFRQKHGRNDNLSSASRHNRTEIRKVSEHKYKTFDLMDQWLKMPMIPRDHKFKNIPLEVLDDLGWRYVPDYDQYFIPYFSASKQSIPFAQYRNLAREPRFIMLKDAKPTCYGTFNLDNPKIFIVEGCSDAAVMQYAGVPWVALPSASSGTLLELLAAYCVKNDIAIVYAGDNDQAGSKLLQALDKIAPYRIKQPPQKYKDWGEMLEATDVETVQNYCFEELFGRTIEIGTNIPKEIEEIFPNSEQVSEPGVLF